MTRFLSVLLSLVAVAAVQPAGATSGPGCYVVTRVASWDVLNMRASPSTSAPVVEMLRPGNHGIIAGDGPCRKASGGRWCRVTHYDGDRVVKGWANIRYLRPSDCP